MLKKTTPERLESMKCLIIVGAERSGKSTLAMRVAKDHHCNIIHMDTLVSAFGMIFPDIGINHQIFDTYQNNKIAPFIHAYADEAVEHGNLVIEGSESFLPIEKITQLFNKDRYKALAIGCAATTAKKMLDIIRKNDTDDEWPYYASDDLLLKRFEIHIEKTRDLFEKCKKLGIATIDTSCDREDKFAEFSKSLVFDKPSGKSIELKQRMKQFFEQNSASRDIAAINT
jgi:hypothetical protein